AASVNGARPHDAGAGRAFTRDQRLAPVTGLVDGTAAAGLVEVVLPGIARREDNRVAVDDEHDAGLERQRASQERSASAVGAQHDSLPLRAAVDRFLNAVGVE